MKPSAAGLSDSQHAVEALTIRMADSVDAGALSRLAQLENPALHARIRSLGATAAA